MTITLFYCNVWKSSGIFFNANFLTNKQDNRVKKLSFQPELFDKKWKKSMLQTITSKKINFVIILF